MHACFLLRSAELRALVEHIKITQYAMHHALSLRSTQLLKNGALFYVIDQEPGTGTDAGAGIDTGGRSMNVCCGFFVGRRTALTINHDPLLKRVAGTQLPVNIVTSNNVSMQLECVSTNSALDFSVLRLRAGAPDIEHFFDLPRAASVEPGLRLALVSMGLGPANDTALVMSPTYTVHDVTATSCHGTFFHYDGAATWAGDSGAALLFEDGCVVGMHLEVIDDRPALEGGQSSKSGGGDDGGDVHGGGDEIDEQVVFAEGSVKRRRSPTARPTVQGLVARLDALSVTSSSHAKTCGALILATPEVTQAVDAAAAVAAPPPALRGAP